MTKSRDRKKSMLLIHCLLWLPFSVFVCNAVFSVLSTVLPTRSDSNIILYLQLQSKK